MNIQKTYRTPNRLNQKRNSSHYIIIKTRNTLNKERILKAVRKKCQVTYKGRPIRITEFSPETIKAWRSWTDVIQTLIEHKCQPRLLYQQNSQLPYIEKPKYSVTKPPLHSIFRSSPSKDNKGKISKDIKGLEDRREKGKYYAFNKPKGREPHEQNLSSNNKNNRKQQLLFLNIS